MFPHASSSSLVLLLPGAYILSANGPLVLNPTSPLVFSLRPAILSLPPSQAVQEPDVRVNGGIVTSAVTMLPTHESSVLVLSLLGEPHGPQTPELEPSFPPPQRNAYYDLIWDL